MIADKQNAHPIGDEICIKSVHFSHDGSRIISAGRSDGTIKLWKLRAYDASEWEEVHGVFPVDEETSLDPQETTYFVNTVTGDMRRQQTCAGVFSRVRAW